MKKLRFMKKLFFVIILITIYSCNSTKELNTSTPIIDVKKAIYQNWYGGLEGVRGVKIIIRAKAKAENCNFTNIYFLDKKAKLVSVSEDELTLEANINTSTRRTQLALKPTQEYGNMPPKKLKYHLEKDEAIIEYTKNGIDKHFKIKLTRKESKFYQ